MSDVIKDAAATYDDLIALSANVIGEIVGGELWSSPRPAARHARSSSILGSEIIGAFDRGRRGPGGWWILFEPELHLGREVLVPDIAGWRRTTMPQIPNVASFDLAPDWVCEVVSPSTAQLDRTKKMPAYAAQGIRHLWLIDPGVKTLETYEIFDGRWKSLARHDGNDIVRAIPFETFELDLSILWID